MAITLTSTPRSIGEALIRRVEKDSLAEYCSLFAPDGTIARVTTGELIVRASGFAESYGLRGGAERKLVAICLPHGRQLHAAFWGAVLAGHLPTILAPPSPRMEPAKYRRSFAKLVDHVRPSILVTDAGVLDSLAREGLSPLDRVGVIRSEEVGDASLPAVCDASADEIALLQHSSGTTGQQKGVALSHNAIFAHNRSFQSRLPMHSDDRVVSWLPLYHDMGLIACFLMPSLLGVPFTEMSAFDWVVNPGLLFDAITRQRGTLCWLPNFAFALLVRLLPQMRIREGTNLSSVRAWINCSEPVTSAALSAFATHFQPIGVRPESLTASYAMAENVFAVTQVVPGSMRCIRASRRSLQATHRVIDCLAESDDAVTLVSNGPLLDDVEVKVLADSGIECGDDCVGEIALRGPFRFDGYYGRPDLTQAVIDDEGWYRTGDLGFLRDSELYVTGRRKDLIILQGKNFYPTDIEDATREVEGVNRGRVVAFGLRDEKAATEELIILAEPASDAIETRALALSIRRHVAQTLDATASDVRVVPARWLVKSSSGKLARSENREKYLRELRHAHLAHA